MIWILSGLCLLLIVIALNLLTWHRARLAEKRYPPQGQFVTVAGLRLHYLRRGEGRGPLLVLLHGSEGFLQDFDAIFDALSPRYDVIAFDRPGHGYSDSPSLRDCAPDRQADLIYQALQQLGIKQPLLVGHSWSGALLLSYALNYPDEVAGADSSRWLDPRPGHAPFLAAQHPTNSPVRSPGDYHAPCPGQRTLFA